MGSEKGSNHESIGAAVATITCNMLELVDIVQIINTISSEDLSYAINAFRKIFLDVFTALETNNPNDGLGRAATELGNRSRIVLAKIQKGEGMDILPENVLSYRVKDVSELIKKFVENAYGLVNSCSDEEGKQMVISLYSRF